MVTRKIKVDFSLEMAPDGVTVSKETVENFIKAFKVIDFEQGHILVTAYLVNGHSVSEIAHGVRGAEVAEKFCKNKIRDKVFELLTFLLSFGSDGD